MAHICVGNLTIIGSDNGMLPDRRQAIIWANAWILLIRPLGIQFNEIIIQTFSFMHIHLEIPPSKWRPFCLGLNVLKHPTSFLEEDIYGKDDTDSKVHGAHLGPVGPRWAPCWPREPCYQGSRRKHEPKVTEENDSNIVERSAPNTT